MAKRAVLKQLMKEAAYWANEDNDDLPAVRFS